MRQRISTKSSVLLLAALFYFSGTPAFAGGDVFNVCEAYNDAFAVFLGRLIPVPGNSDTFRAGDRKVATVEVIESFKRLPAGFCLRIIPDKDLTKGTIYLFLIHSSGKAITWGQTSEYVNYFRSFNTGKSQQFYGRAVVAPGNAFSPVRFPVNGLPVKLTNAFHSFESETKNGDFLFPDVPPSEYEIEILVPENYAPYLIRKSVTICKGCCYQPEMILVAGPGAIRTETSVRKIPVWEALREAPLNVHISFGLAGAFLFLFLSQVISVFFACSDY